MVKYLSELQGRIKNSSDSGNSSLCPEDLSNLLSWKQRIRQEDVDDLAQFGVREMKEIARKYQNLFPDLLKAPYDKDKFLFQSSYMERNILSAKAFANGLFGNEEVEVSHNPKGQDSLLQFYKNCHKASQTRKNPMPERTKFIQGHINQVTIPAIETFLGFAKGSLTFDHIDAMYKMCVFDHVVYDDSPWCAVFSRQNLVTMEYLEDLRNYYLEGPAYQINTDQSCDLLKDVAKYLRMPSKESPGNYPAGVFRFTHSPVINSFLAQLGVFDGQDALRSSNMAEQDQRKWRLSLKDPYSAHVALVVNERTDSKFELLTFINERLSSSHDWDTVMSTVGETADSCDFNAVCENSGVNISRVNYLVIFAIILGCVI
ncbi:multiple inositol polyphosphate phosphatase 1-like isoform X2 [Liolophura sinensis]